MGGIYDKNLFTLGKKLDLLKNLLLTGEREVRFLCKNLFFLVAGMLRAAQRRAEFAKTLQSRVRFKKSSQQTRTRYLCLLQYFQLHYWTCFTMGLFFIVPENKYVFS